MPTASSVEVPQIASGTPLAGLLDLLALEKLEENLFRGQSQDLGWGTVFGGQVLGQSLYAATQTVPTDRHVHSLHAYFLRPGDVKKPIVYEVDRIRDGGSFTTRRVVAVQSGHPIFHMSASFQIREPGFTHADPMPDAPPPESLPTDQERVAKYVHRLPPVLRERSQAERPFEMRTADPEDDPIAPQKRPGKRMIWLRANGKLPDDDALHAKLLAYVSDYGFIATSLFPHGVNWVTPGMQVASIDHLMWFHQPFRCDDWLLHVVESPSASGSRGFVRGSVYTRDGRLVVSTAQEGLIRQRTPHE